MTPRDEAVNPLLDVSGPARYGAIRAEHMEPAIRAAIADAGALRAKLVAGGGPPTWDGLVAPLDEADERVPDLVRRDLVAAGVRAVEGKARDELRTRRRERDGRTAGTGRAEERRGPLVERLEHRRGHRGLVGDAELDGACREPGPRAVVPDDRVRRGETLDPRAERDRLPLQLQVADPPAPEEQRRPVPDGRKGDAAVRRLEEADPLLHAGR